MDTKEEKILKLQIIIEDILKEMRDIRGVLNDEIFKEKRKKDLKKIEDLRKSLNKIN